MPNFYDDRGIESPSELPDGRTRYPSFSANLNDYEEDNDDEVTEWVNRRAYMDQDDDQDQEQEHQHYGEDEEPAADDEAGDSSDTTTDKMYKDGIKELDANGLVDIGNSASWSVTSSKQGYGVGNLRDDSPFTYWQSDGQLPHSVVIRFTKSVSIERISLFLNYLTDESYTPSSLQVFAGTGDHDLIEVLNYEMESPIGWRHIKFDDTNKSRILKCFMVKIVFLANHQNGKDTHLRSIKIMGVGTKEMTSMSDFNNDTVGFTSLQLIRETVIR